MKTWVKSTINWLISFPSRHPKIAHTTVTVWNLFIASWATGEKIDLSSYGFPGHVFDARGFVSLMQAHYHLPTWTVGVVTVLVNAVIAYSHWKKNESKS